MVRNIPHNIILICEDQKQRNAISKTLFRNGYQCDIAETIPIAINLLSTNKYLLIIHDIETNDLYSTEYAELIKTVTNKSNLQLIISTTNLDTLKSLNPLKEKWLLDIIHKPIDEKLLLIKLRNLYEFNRSKLELKRSNRILERKRIRSQISFQDLYNSFEKEIFLINRDGIVVSINRFQKLICGVDACEIQGKHFQKSKFLSRIIESENDFEKKYFKTELPSLGIKKQFEHNDSKKDLLISATLNKVIIEGVYYIQIIVSEDSRTRKVENQLSLNFREIHNYDKINQALIKGISIEDVSSLLIENLSEITSGKTARVYLIDDVNNKLILASERLDSEFIISLREKTGIMAQQIIPPIDETSFFRKIINEKRIVVTSEKSEILTIIRSHTDNKLLQILASWTNKLLKIGTMGILPLLSNKNVFGIITFISEKKLESREKIAIARFVKHASMVLWRKKIEQDLEKSEERFNLAMQGSNDGIWDWDIKTNKVYRSPRWLNMIGYEHNELPNSIEVWASLLHPEDKQRTLSSLNSYLKGKSTDYSVEFRLRHKKGHYIDVLSRGIGVKDSKGNFVRLVGTHVDITSRKKEEEERALLSSIIESTTDLVGIAGLDHKIVYMNLAGKKMLGYDEENFERKHLSEIIPEKVYNNFIKKMLLITSKKGGLSGETIFFTKHNNKIPVSFVIIAHKNHMGEVKYFSTVARDISKIRETQVKLRESEAFTKSILSSIGSQIAVIDTEGNIISVNDSWTKFSAENGEHDFIKTGVGNNYYTICEKAIAHNEKYAKEALEGIKAVANKEIPKFELEYECNSATQNRWYVMSVTGFKNDHKKIVIRHIDITRRKENEEMLRRSQLEIRNFAGHLNKVIEDERSRIAREMHDEIGQQLSGIKMGLSLIEKDAKVNEKLSSTITETSKLLENTIKSMRKIATELRPGILDTLGLIPSLRWLCEEFEKKYKISVLFKADSLQEVFNKNISTCYFRICQESLNNVFKHSGASQVIVSVELRDLMLSLKIIDNGSGMSENTLQNPFSMGLLGMKERALNIGGEVFINSILNEGTTVEIITTLE